MWQVIHYLYRKIQFEYKIASIYLIMGFLWIFFSDTIFDQIIEDKHQLTEINIYKGFLYVIVTSILLFYLVKRHIKKLHFAEKLINQRSEEIRLQNQRYVELNRDLQISKDKAEESDRLKSAFLANMSHEIRTPMNGILGFASLLKESGLSGDQQSHYIEIIEKSGQRMLGIINDIIDISRIESEQMKVYLQECSINEQLEYIITFFKPEIESKNLEFLCNNFLSKHDYIVITDSIKLNAILTNLVKNAIKYTNEGFIEIGIDKQNEYFQFYIKDSGIGIPKNRQEAIFERFIQADIEDKMALQGAGLGLAISKAYCTMLGGTIWLESEINKGSTFFFTIPARRK